MQSGTPNHRMVDPHLEWVFTSQTNLQTLSQTCPEFPTRFKIPESWQPRVTVTNQPPSIWHQNTLLQVQNLPFLLLKGSCPNHNEKITFSLTWKLESLTIPTHFKIPKFKSHLRLKATSYLLVLTNSKLHYTNLI